MAIVVPVVTTFDAKGISRAISNFKKLEGSAAKTGFALRAVDQGITSFGKTVAKFGAIAGAVAGVVGFKLVQAGSDLEESMSKVEVVFGTAAASVVKFSDEAATNLGISKQAALEASGSYGNLLQAFGVGQGAAQEMSTTLVQLAADLASFNNANIDDVLLALRSGLSGEAEPLKKFGIAINDVRLKEQAMSMGIVNTTKGVLPIAAKAQAAYALIMKDSSLAQGDFARTSDGVANLTRIVAANFQDLKAELGTALLPVFKDLLNFLNDRIMPVLREFSVIVGKEGIGAGLKFLGGQLLDTIEGLEGTAQKIFFAITALAAFKAGMVAFGIATTVTTVLMTVFGASAKAASAAAAPIALIAFAVVAVGVALVAAYIKFEGFRKVVNFVINAVIGYFEMMINSWISAINLFVKAANAVNGLLGKIGIKLPQVAEIGKVSFGRIGNSATDAGKKIGDVADETDRLIQRFQASRSVDASGGGGVTGGGGGGGESVLDRAKRQLKEYTDGLKGVQSAQRSLTESSKSLRDAQRNVLDSANDVRDAQNGLRKATQNVMLAEEALERVRRGLGAGSDESKRAANKVDDAQRSLEESGYSLEDAQFAVIDATQKLADLRTSKEAVSSRDIREAEIDLARAKLQLTERQLAQKASVEELSEAQTEFNEITNGAEEGTDRYTEAMDALTKAKEEQDIASKKVLEALDKEKDAIEKVTEAQNKLRDATYEVLDAEKALEELRKEVDTAIRRRATNQFNARNAGFAPGVTIPSFPDFSDSVMMNPQRNLPDTVVNIHAPSLDPASAKEYVYDALVEYSRYNGPLNLQIAV